MDGSPPLPPADAQQQQQRRYIFDAGDVVILHNLIQSTHVNGRRGVVHFPTSLISDEITFPPPPPPPRQQQHAAAATNAAAPAQRDENDPNNEESRLLVRLLPESGTSNTAMLDGSGNSPFNSCISVKAKNMILDYPPGQKVLLQGLVGAQHLNGRIATIVKFSKKKTRFLVEFPLEENDNGNGDGDNVTKFSSKDESMKHRPLSVDEKRSMCDELNNLLALKKVKAEADDKESKHVDGQSKSNEDAEDQDEEQNEEAKPKVKQILVSPKNIIHLPNTKPPPIPSLTQRLIFSGPMKSIVNLLNQSVHKVMTPSDVFEGNGFGLLSRYPPDDTDFENDREREQSMAETACAAKLWGRIQQRSYKCLGHGSSVTATTVGVDNDNEKDDSDDTTAANGGSNNDTINGTILPRFYQKLIPTSNGRTHRICFNPKCHAILPPGKEIHARMKRCTKCHSIAYCNRQCALADWDYHKKVCRTIQNQPQQQDIFGLQEHGFGWRNTNHEEEGSRGDGSSSISGSGKGVRFADYVSLTSPQRNEVIDTQRMIRLCVNRIAATTVDDPAAHFSHGANAETAKLLYDTITQGGTDVANEILLHLENSPPPDREITVAVGFNSLGDDPIFEPKDVQLFANIYNCKVTYRVLGTNLQDDGNNDTAEKSSSIQACLSYVELLSSVMETGIERAPNGEEIQMPNQMPDDVQEGFMNFLNNIIPGANNVAGGGGQNFFVPPGMFNNENNNGNPPPGEADAAGDGNDNNGAGAAADANNGNNNQMPAGLANFLNYAMNEAGVGVGNANNDNANGDNDNGGEEANIDEDLPPAVEDVADAPPADNANAGQQRQQLPQGGPNGPGGFQFNFPNGGGAHVHVAHVNAPDNLPPGMPQMPPPGAFFQMPGMPVGVQVAVAQAGPDENNGGMGGLPPPLGPPGAFQPIPGMPVGMPVGIQALIEQAGVFPPMGLEGDEANDGNARSGEVEEETEMEIED